ncbi:MAG: hypothetical protein O3A51_06825, partial [Verrucomicrobia bacterium]|nr:hypothetical protein [Verrucomicrobiota bacterium]
VTQTSMDLEAAQGQLAELAAQPAPPDPKAPTAQQWFLKLDDGAIFGPVPMAQLADWAGQCRIGPDHQISQDRNTWMAAKSLPDLRMEWLVELVDGTRYGPLNRFAIAHLIADGSVASDASLRHVDSGEDTLASDVVTPEFAAMKATSSELTIRVQELERLLSEAHARIRDLESPATAEPANAPPKLVRNLLIQRTRAPQQDRAQA